MELKGKLKAINDLVVVSDKFKKREFVVTTDDKFPQDILFQLSQNNCDLIDEFVLGEEVVVGFNLRGREWVNSKTGEVRYFNTLDAWRIGLSNGNPMKPSEDFKVPVAKTSEVRTMAEGTDEIDDLPF